MNKKSVTITLNEPMLKDFSKRVASLDKLLIKLGGEIKFCITYDKPKQGQHELTYWVEGFKERAKRK